MVSVTSEIASTLSFQGAQRPQKSDAPAGDSFASLVDSNTAAADNNGRAAEPPPSPANNPSAPRRQDDTAAANNGRARENSAVDKPANNSADRDTAPAEQAKPEADAKPEQTRRTKSKAGESTTDEAKSTSQPDSDETPAADAAGTEQDVATGTAVDAIAVAITVPVVPAETPAPQAPAAANSTAPLAIAAAAIAATASVTGANPVATATEANPTGANPVSAGGAAAGTAADAGKTVNPAQPSIAADAAVVTDTALAASIAAPVLAKAAAATSKPSPAAKDATAKTGDQEITVATDASATTAIAPAVPADAVQPAAPSGKHGAEHAAAEGLKSEPQAGASASANGATHNHLASAETVQPPVSSPTNALPTAATMQPQLQPTAAQASPQFTVTAATQAAAVPLSGLAIEIAASARSGKSRFEIRLDPAELGRIDVRIDIDRHGQVTSHLTVEKPETLQMLRQDANQLHRALNDAGLSTNGGGLQFSLRDQSSSGQNDQNQSNPHAQRLIVAEEEVIPATVAGSYGRMFGPSGGVDIRV